MKSSAAALLLLLVVSHDPRRPRFVFRTVSAGASHTCGIAAGGAGHLAFVSLSAGDGFTCGITDAGMAYCWGRNTYGQLGSFAPLRTEVPIPVVAGGVAF